MGDLRPDSPAVQLDLFVLANLVFLTALYLWAARRARAHGGTWHAGSTIAFVAAMAALGLAYLGPFGAWAHDAFWAHMGQHLLVLMIAAPLIVLSSPIMLTFINLGPSGRRRLVRILRSRPVELLSNPIVGWVLFATVLLGSHTQIVMNWSVSHHDAMDFVMRPLYLAVALIFYFPLVGRDLLAYRPEPSVRVASLGLMMIPETVLGMVVHFAPVPLYFAYVQTAAAQGFDPLVDQKFAGAMMWAIAMVLDGIWMMLAALEWWRDQERATERLERRELTGSAA
jgi:putative copper resistance protein D